MTEQEHKELPACLKMGKHPVLPAGPVPGTILCECCGLPANIYVTEYNYWRILMDSDNRNAPVVLPDENQAPLRPVQEATINKLVREKYGHPDFYKLLEQMAELHSRKNHDYAGTSDPLKNLRACERLDMDPFLGVMVRLQDKWSRLEEFIKQGVMLVKDESVEDTLMDNAVYSLLAIILRREAKIKATSDE